MKVLNTTWFELLIIRVLMILTMAIVTLSTVWLFVLFGTNLWEKMGNVHNALELQEAVQRGIGGIFVVLLGLELLETMKTYITHRRFRLEVVLVVGAIAVARHIIQLDFHHIDGGFLAGLGVLIASLVYGYYILQRIPESQGGSKHEESAAAAKE